MNPIKHTLTLFSSLFLTPLAALHAAGPPHMLLLEALQYENIGDSGRVPGTIRQLDQYLRVRRSRFCYGSFMNVSARCSRCNT